MHLFFNSELSLETSQVVFDKIESKHIIKVLRKNEGDILQITNGKEMLFSAEILIANDKKCTAKIVSKTERQKSWNYYLHVAIAPTKNNDRMEWFLEKATEIGIDEITPIFCHHSERRNIKMDRFEKIIQSAMKQSLKCTLPKLNKPIKFKDFIHQDYDGAQYIAHCEEGEEKEFFKSVIQSADKITILIGPEGDFSSDEIQKALWQKFTPVSLGKSRLRTETAALMAVATVSLSDN